MTSLKYLMSVAIQGPESSAASELESPAFSLREVKALRQDLFPPKPFVYWGDLLLTVIVAYGLTAVYYGSGLCFPGRHIQSKSHAFVA